MPLTLNRCENIGSQLNRLGYEEGLEIKRAVKTILQENPLYYFTADELSARIQPSAAPAQIEHILSQHDEEFTHKIQDEQIYWSVK